MINNRQGGRRRGRGGQRGQNLGGQPGNRQDNRQRGNAAQLLEKYKSMARDAQLAGDRVQTEYLLQFADHYYRVLGESRARFEDQRPRRDQDMDEDAESSASDNEHGFQQADDEFAEANDGQATDSDERPQRAERPQHGERFNRQDRPRRPNDGDDQRSARPSRDGDDSDPMNGGETIPFDVLPPAIGRDETDSGDAEAAPKRPRRRARTPRPEEGEDEAAPAA